MKRLTLFLACLLGASLALAQMGGDTTTDTDTRPGAGTTDTTGGAITNPGDTGLDSDGSVTQTQDAVQKLYDLGYGSSPEDIRRYQEDNGLQGTGELNDETLNSLGFERSPAGVDEESGSFDQMDQPMDEPTEGDQNLQDEGF